MRIGIIGLPASGKSTVYRLLTHGQPSHHASQLGEAAIAVVKVPDPRLERLALMFEPKKVTPASFELVDFAPLVKESGKPTSPGGQLLPQMRQATALLMVVRAFKDERVPHIEGRVDPAKDAATLQAELVLADLDVVEKRIARIEEAFRKGKKGESLQELALLKRCYAALQEEQPLQGMSLTAEEERLLRGFQFLTAKPSRPRWPYRPSWNLSWRIFPPMKRVPSVPSSVLGLPQRRDCVRPAMTYWASRHSLR